jgi:hypothetical protein
MSRNIRIAFLAVVVLTAALLVAGGPWGPG